MAFDILQVLGLLDDAGREAAMSCHASLKSGRLNMEDAVTFLSCFRMAGEMAKEEPAEPRKRARRSGQFPAQDTQPTTSKTGMKAQRRGSESHPMKKDKRTGRTSGRLRALGDDDKEEA